MPRSAREISENSTYHIMLRGINQQQIFEEAEDYTKFLEILKHYQAVSEYKVYAYCLMGNHIHLLMEFGKEDIGQVFKRIGAKYVYWYNIKYGRKGHLFQDRYKSEPVDDDSYFLTVMRYMHQNPIKAGLCKKVDGYKYSSFQEYKYGADIVDINCVYKFVPESEFEDYNNEIINSNCLDIENQPIKRVTDEEARRIIKKYSKCENVTDFQTLNIKERDKYIKKFKEKGISIRQISRLTGVPKGIVEKIIYKT